MKEKKDTSPLSAKTTLSDINKEQDNRVFPPDYIDKIRWTRTLSKEEMDKLAKTAKEIKKLAITCQKPIFTAQQQRPTKLGRVSGGASLNHPSSFTFTMRKSRMGLSREQQRNHEPHDIGINDLLANMFRFMEEDVDFASKMPFLKVNTPDPARRWELTMGRNGSMGRSSRTACMTLQANPPLSPAQHIEDKKFWLAKAIRFQKASYPKLFVPGELIGFVDTGKFYLDFSSTRRPFEEGITVKNERHSYSSYFDNDGHAIFSAFSKTHFESDKYFHGGDTGLVVQDNILARTTITNQEEWAGVVTFHRELELLLTTHHRDEAIEIVEPGRVMATTELGEPKTRQAIILLSPHKVSSSGQQDRLFLRLENSDETT